MKKKIYSREEIKTGLKLCSTDEDFNNCKDCPFCELDLGKCESFLMKLAAKELEKSDRAEKKEKRKENKFSRRKI